MNGVRLDRSFFRLHPSALVSAAAIFYLLHIIFHGKIATVELGAFFTIFCLGWARARREVRFSFHILYYPLLVYAVISTLSAIASGRQQHAFWEAMLWFKMLIFPAALILYREVPRLRRLAIAAYAIFATYISVWGILQFILLDQRILENRIKGPTTHVMTFSGLILPLSLLFLFLWMYERRPWQFAVFSVATVTLLLTFTRSVWIGWLFAAFSILAFTRPRVMAYAVPALILLITFAPMALFARLASTFDVRQASNFDRIRMIEAGIEIIKDRPLLGVGPGNVKYDYALYKKHDAPRVRPPHLHNNVIHLWAERGVIGLAAYLLFLTLAMRECIRAWHGPARMWGEIGVAVLVSLAVAGLFEFNWGDTEVFYMLLNLLALVFASIEQTRSLPNEQSAAAVPNPHSAAVAV